MNSISLIMILLVVGAFVTSYIFEVNDSIKRKIIKIPPFIVGLAVGIVVYMAIGGRSVTMDAAICAIDIALIICLHLTKKRLEKKRVMHYEQDGVKYTITKGKR